MEAHLGVGRGVGMGNDLRVWYGDWYWDSWHVNWMWVEKGVRMEVDTHASWM